MVRSGGFGASVWVIGKVVSGLWIVGSMGFQEIFGLFSVEFD